MTTKTTTKIKKEAPLQEFTASFLLSEFRKDMRHIDKKFDTIDAKFNAIDAKFDRVNSKIEGNFKWTLGTMIVIAVSIIGVILVH